MPSQPSSTSDRRLDSVPGESWWSIGICLRWVVALQCLGVAGRLLLGAMESESDIFEYLLFELGVVENTAQKIDDFGACGCLIAAAVLLIGSVIGLRRFKSDADLGFDSTLKPKGRPGAVALRWFEVAAAIYVVAWTVVVALAHTLRGDVYAELALGESAVRIVCPLVLIAWLGVSGNAVTRASTAAKWMLMWAISVTYAVHGYKALMLHGGFVDLVLLSDVRVFKLGLEQTTVETTLLVIGWIDVLLAIALVTMRWRWGAVYMLIWGAVTAASRTTAMGWPALSETIIRSANWGAPLALLLIWRWESGRSRRTD